MNQISEALKMLMIVLQLITSLGLSIESTKIDGFNEQIYTVKAKLGDELRFSHKLAKNQVFGFETVEEMANNESQVPDIGVNGAFYNDVGRAVGILIMNGELITKQSIGTPLFVLRNNGQVELLDPELTTYIVHNNKRYETFEVNEGLTNTLIGVFTKWYGSSNRRHYNHTAITVEKGLITSIIKADASVDIPFYNTNLNDNDFMLAYEALRYEFPVRVGDLVKFEVESNFDIETVREAFQTGGWLVKDGINVSSIEKNYVGPTDSLQPRTVIGITQNQEIIIKIVDGRNPGVSEGLTGNQIADLLIKEGCVQGAFLDGGASSTIVQEGKVINNPSLGEPKGVAHALFFDKDYQKVVAK